ncbi:interferon-induced protein with tetratricopeptide repeats 8 [Aplochiton taeniatus]
MAQYICINHSELDSEGENSLENKLQKLECHFTWDLAKEEVKDLNFLEVKLFEALGELQQAGDEGNLETHSLNLLAYVKHLMGDNKKALEYLDRAEREKGEEERMCVVTYGNSAWLHHHNGEDARAEKYVQKVELVLQASTLSTMSTLLREVYSEKAWSLLKFSGKHYMRAKECFAEAVQREPEDKEWNEGYALALFRVEGLETREDRRLPYQSSPAVKQLKRALQLSPDNAILRVYLGLKCYKNQRNAEAWVHMRKAQSLAPRQLSVQLQVSKFMKKEKCFDTALAVLMQMLQRAPNSSRLHLEIAQNYRWKGIDSGNPHDQKLIKRCVYHLEEAKRLNPTHIYPQVELAARYAEVGETKKSEEQFQELWSRPDLVPKDRQAWHRMYGDFHLHRLGAEKTAVSHYKEGMRLGNMSTEWYQCRDRLHKVLNSNRERNDPFQIAEFLHSVRLRSSDSGLLTTSKTRLSSEGNRALCCSDSLGLPFPLGFGTLVD